MFPDYLSVSCDYSWNKTRQTFNQSFRNVFFQDSNKWNENVGDSWWKTALKNAEETEEIFQHCKSSRYNKPKREVTKSAEGIDEKVRDNGYLR